MRSSDSQIDEAWLLFECLIVLNLILAFPAFAQEPQEQDKPAVQQVEKEPDEVEQRRMFRTFTTQRHAAASGVTRTPSSGTRTPSRNPTADRSTSTGTAEVPADAFVGFTVWEMRESDRGTERRSFRLKKPDGQNVVMRPFRLRTDTPLVDGHSYVFSIESARTGYLYIIDREQYSNGKLGDPQLLFPSRDIHGGANKITAGNVVEIPDQKAEKAFFEATRNGPGHVGEVLTIIVSPEPLINPARLKEDSLVLSADEVKKWERQWATRARWAENTDAIGRAYTDEEGHAGGDPGYKLKEGDPLPQRLFQLSSKAGSSLIVTLTLRYSESANGK